jgi:ATP-dependent protease Clp ATPase subunit
VALDSEPGRPGHAEVNCSFCAHERDYGDHEVIAGPGVYICRQCIAKAGEAIVTGNQVPLTAGRSIGPLPRDSAADRCSFCGTRGYQVDALAGTAGNPPTIICTECLTLCDEIMAEEPTP